MELDVFFSLSQTPSAGKIPSEAQMFRNFFEQVKAADELGFGVAWIAESHLSSEVQKRNRQPVIPHWEGEVGLNVDFPQIATRVFAATRRIGCGSAIMNILCNGGPVAAAERLAAFLAFHGLDPAEQRRIHVGFAGGRFDFMNRAYGIGPRDAAEARAWPVLKGVVFAEAAEIFVRLLAGETLSSDDITAPVVLPSQFRTPADWEAVRALAGCGDRWEVPRRFVFEALKIVPQEFRRELLQLVIGSHDLPTQEHVNKFLPVQVFNLSITSPAVIEDTHRRMATAYHPAGGPWHRSYMPRTVFVFLNEQPGLTPESRREAAHREAREALGAYWKALEGTLDPRKIESAADNALIGNADDVARQMAERFHPDDRIMAWFDFFNHDSARVVANMAAFVERVVPRVAEHR
jgi:alkanesulfonate monooxygenase SsuD/methylene tetrahydromethanopterin reductase-like flavin-dependent oxidoreductase (luciferase family)